MVTMLMRSVLAEMSRTFTDGGSRRSAPPTSDPIDRAKRVDPALDGLGPLVVWPVKAVVESVHDADHPGERHGDEKLVFGEACQPASPEVEEQNADVARDDGVGYTGAARGARQLGREGAALPVEGSRHRGLVQPRLGEAFAHFTVVPAASAAARSASANRYLLGVGLSRRSDSHCKGLGQARAANRQKRVGTR